VKRYKVEFKGFACIEAHTVGEAIEKLYDDDCVYTVFEEPIVVEVEEFEVEL